MAPDLTQASLFTFAALLLLGSPGPGIAALVAIGRSKGFVGGLPFFGGLQVGLASAAAICAAGLFSLLAALPYATWAMTVIAVAYLVTLAIRIATAPVGTAADSSPGNATSDAAGGFLLGISNPKAYLAFVSLMAAYPILPGSRPAELALKWLILIAVIVAVDLAWLRLGAAIGKVALAPAAERALNLAMAAAIALTAVLAAL